MRAQAGSGASGGLGGPGGPGESGGLGGPGGLGERPSALQRLGVVLVLTGVVVAVSGNAPEASRRPGTAYSRRSTRIIRHAPAASTGESVSKSP